MIVNSPVVAMMTAIPLFKSYSSGTFVCFNTTPITRQDLNHSIQLIGYDKWGNYIIKNSWGTSWGDNGYGTVSYFFDCGIKLFACQYGSNETSIITLDSPQIINNTANNTTNVKKSG